MSLFSIRSAEPYVRVSCKKLKKLIETFLYLSNPSYKYTYVRVWIGNGAASFHKNDLTHTCYVRAINCRIIFVLLLRSIYLIWVVLLNFEVSIKSQYTKIQVFWEITRVRNKFLMYVRVKINIVKNIRAKGYITFVLICLLAI